MRLVTFERDGAPSLGILRGDRVVDLSALDPAAPRDWATVFAEDNLERWNAIAANAPDEKTVPRDGLTLLPAIPRPPKTLCVGLNYRAHAEETGAKIPETPIFFARFPSSFCGDGQPMLRPSASDKFDYEGELVAVVGRGGKHIPRERALEHVVGYSIFNDGSIRDYQRAGKQWTLGKNGDASGPFGPEIVTADELPAGASGLRIETRVNGAVMQEGRTDDLIFDIAALVSKASEVMTLEPGTVFVTGTPPGVGFARDPQVFLKPGDTVSVAIEGIGTLTNPVVAEADGAA